MILRGKTPSATRAGTACATWIGRRSLTCRVRHCGVLTLVTSLSHLDRGGGHGKMARHIGLSRTHDGGCLMNRLIDDLDDIIRQYEAQVAELRGQVQQQQKELERIEQGLVHLQETRVMLSQHRLQPQLATEMRGSPDQPGAQLSIKQMVLSILEVHNRAMTAAHIYGECESRGWAVARNSLNTTLSKLATQDRLIVRVDVGQYALPRAVDRAGKPG